MFANRFIPHVLKLVFAPLLINVVFVSATTAQVNSKLDPAIKQRLEKSYPGQAVVNSCDGNFLGKHGSAVVALRDSARKNFNVVWVMAAGGIQTLTPAEDDGSSFEFQCMDKKQVNEIRKALRSSEAIQDFLKVPAGSGAVCYFLDNTTTSCWSPDPKSDRLKQSGGWQT